MRLFALLLNFAIVYMLVGLILTIHFVHYPSFRFQEENFAAFHNFHTNAISKVVVPMMLAELAINCILVVMLWQTQLRLFALAALLCTLSIWGVTFLMAVPAHTQLGQGFSHKTISQLLDADRIRTILWVIGACIVSVTTWRYLHEF
ncbi:MAG: hypothetical protein AAF639_36175 [Chloroflexota bacterium]